MGGRLLEVRATNRQLVDEEIRRAIADAIEARDIVRAGPLAERLACTYPGSGWPTDLIAYEIERAAARAGVALELSTPLSQARRPETLQAGL